MTFVLWVFFAIHLFDYFLYGCTQSKLDMWKVIDPRSRSKLYKESNEENDDLRRYKCAWGVYVMMSLVRLVVMSLLFQLYILPYRSCEPFVSVTLYQDYFFTMAVPIWVIIETQMTKSSHKLTCDAIIEAD